VMGTSSLRAADAASQFDFLPAPYRNIHKFFNVCFGCKILLTPLESDRSGASAKKSDCRDTASGSGLPQLEVIATRIGSSRTKITTKKGEKKEIVQERFCPI
jgi:hypothetical protein